MAARRTRETLHEHREPAVGRPSHVYRGHEPAPRGQGVVTPEEIDRALATAEETAVGDYRVAEDVSPANRDAIVFPVRLLRLANNVAGERSVPPFSELARMVGETKEPYNDQR